MAEAYPRSTVRIAGRPIHPMLVPIPIACFVGTLVTDIVYWRTADILWGDFSDWLVTVGAIVGIIAAIVGAIELVGDGRIRALPQAWIHAVGNLIVLVVAIFDALVHTRDAYGTVHRAGLILSIVVVALLLVTGWMGWAMVYRHGVGLRVEDRP